MTESLHTFLSESRWFAGKGRDFEVTGMTRVGVLPGPPVVAIELVEVTFAGAETETYQVPLAYYPAAEHHLEHAFVGAWDDEDFGPVHAYDALHDRRATALWLSAFASEHAEGTLRFHRLPGHDLDLTTHSTLFTGEQSNSSVAFGDDAVMKVFRKVSRGRNPDIDIHAELTRAESDHVAALYGWLEAVTGPDEEPLHLAMLQQFLRTATDGWDLALASVRDLFGEADLHADEVGGDFAGEAGRLGVALAEVHADLAARFPTETWGAPELATLHQAMRGRLDAAVEAAPALAPYAEGLRATYAALEGVTEPVAVQRVHGDLHLGQTLRTVRGWKMVDFEGEPAKSLAERVLPDSPWRDVAGMLRSFDYAARAVEADVEAGDDEGHQQIAYRAAEWSERNRGAFLAAYVEATTTPTGADQEALLRAYEADKAVYETVYETRNRPSWIGIPLAAVARLATTPEGP